jgi:hypothetical protein
LCRSGIRFGLVRDQRAAAVGFRCAASLRPGADVARTMNEKELAPENRAQGAAPLPRGDPRRALALDADLRTTFGPVAAALEENESRIVGELNGVQGSPVDIGGYYHPDPAKTAAAMRPSATFNRIVDAL